MQRESRWFVVPVAAVRDASDAGRQRDQCVLWTCRDHGLLKPFVGQWLVTTLRHDGPRSATAMARVLPSVCGGCTRAQASPSTASLALWRCLHVTMHPSSLVGTVALMACGLPAPAAAAGAAVPAASSVELELVAGSTTRRTHLTGTWTTTVVASALRRQCVQVGMCSLLSLFGGGSASSSVMVRVVRVDNDEGTESAIDCTDAAATQEPGSWLRCVGSHTCVSWRTSAGSKSVPHDEGHADASSSVRRWTLPKKADVIQRVARSLVGVEEWVAQLWASCASVCARQPGSTGHWLVQGVHGVGKSALCRAFADAVGASVSCVELVRCLRPRADASGLALRRAWAAATAASATGCPAVVIVEGLDLLRRQGGGGVGGNASDEEGEEDADGVGASEGGAHGGYSDDERSKVSEAVLLDTLCTLLRAYNTAAATEGPPIMVLACVTDVQRSVPVSLLRWPYFDAGVHLDVPSETVRTQVIKRMGRLMVWRDVEAPSSWHTVEHVEGKADESVSQMEPSPCSEDDTAVDSVIVGRDGEGGHGGGSGGGGGGGGGGGVVGLTHAQAARIAQWSHGMTPADVSKLLTQAVLEARRRSGMQPRASGGPGDPVRVDDDVAAASQRSAVTLMDVIRARLHTTPTVLLRHGSAAGGVQQADSAMYRMGGRGAEVATMQSLDALAGLTAVKQVLRQAVVQPLQKHQRWHGRFGVGAVPGVLLYGPSGNGKTHLARAVAAEAGVNVLHVQATDIVSKVVGASEQALVTLLQRAKQARPCVLILDNVEQLARNVTLDQDTEEHSGTRLIACLVAELDALQQGCDGDVVLIGTTTRRDLIHPHVLQPGRLSLHICVDQPDAEQRRCILLQALSRMPVQPNASHLAQRLADLTPGASAAQLISLCREAAVTALRYDVTAMWVHEHHFNLLRTKE